VEKVFELCANGEDTLSFADFLNVMAIVLEVEQ
jgi:hypothetical protein